MNFSRTLASGMEVSDYFAPAITVIELAQETSICIVIVSQQNFSAVSEDVSEEEDKMFFD